MISAATAKAWRVTPEKVEAAVRKIIGEAPKKIGQLKMLASDGKIRLTDCTNPETLWRPLHSLPPERRST